MKIEAEFRSVDEFVQFCMDDERSTFLPGDAQKIAMATGIPSAEVIAELKSYGLTPVLNRIQREVRGFSSNPNGTFPFSGANSTFTTPGGDNIMGFAGRKG